MPVEEEGQGDVEHVEGFGEALGTPVEARQIVPDGGIGCLDEVGLGLGLDMRLADGHPFESEVIAGIGVGKDGLDVPYGALGQPVYGHGAVDALVADVIGHHPAKPAAEGGPDYGALLFFWTKV